MTTEYGKVTSSYSIFDNSIRESGNLLFMIAVILYYVMQGNM